MMPHIIHVLRSFLSVSLLFIVFTCASCYGDPWNINTIDPEDPHAKYFAVELVSWKPAPGQFVNSSSYGIPGRALGAPDGRSVTLGGFGGELVLKMGEAITDRPGEADFVVWGNAFYYQDNPRARWAEPATVEISSNGTDWILLGGSIFSADYSPDAALTEEVYTRADDALWPSWADHLDELRYTLPELGVLFHERLGEASSYTNAAWEEVETLYGFADCTPRSSTAPWYVPNDPYHFGVEGSGGDVLFLEWAVDAAGNSIYEDIRDGLFYYVRLRTAVINQADTLGEFSSEIDAVGIFF